MTSQPFPIKALPTAFSIGRQSTIRRRGEGGRKGEEDKGGRGARNGVVGAGRGGGWGAVG